MHQLLGLVKTVPLMIKVLIRGGSISIEVGIQVGTASQVLILQEMIMTLFSKVPPQKIGNLNSHLRLILIQNILARRNIISGLVITSRKTGIFLLE